MTVKYTCSIMIVLVAAVGLESTGGDDLPQTARDAREAYANALAKAQRRHDRAVRRAHDRYLEELESAMKDATRAGELDQALATRELRNQVKSQRPRLLAEYSIAPPSITEPDEEIQREQEMSVDWQYIYGNSAHIRATALEGEPLQESADRWQRVPETLRQREAIIYSGRQGKDAGTADFEVLSDGILLVACNYDYQGNSSGDWDEKRWTQDTFIANGWALVPETALGGVLVQSDGREQVLFMKPARQGEHYRLRCNKYDPPFVIVFP